MPLPDGAGASNARDIPTMMLTCGYYDAHSVNEHLALADMATAAEWAVQVAQVAAGQG